MLNPPHPKQKSEMMEKKKKKYEYKVTYQGSHEINESNMSKFLNEMGQEGWELSFIEVNRYINEHGVSNRIFIFKREI